MCHQVHTQRGGTRLDSVFLLFINDMRLFPTGSGLFYVEP
jgi:hypothetical protein